MVTIPAAQDDGTLDPFMQPSGAAAPAEVEKPKPVGKAIILEMQLQQLIKSETEVHAEGAGGGDIVAEPGDGGVPAQPVPEPAPIPEEPIQEVAAEPFVEEQVEASAPITDPVIPPIADNNMAQEIQL